MDKNGVLRFRKAARILLMIFAFGMVLFHEYTTATLPLTGFMQTAVHLGLAMSVVCCAAIAKSDSEKLTRHDVLLSVMLLMALAFNIRILATGGFISAKMTANISTFDMIFAVFAVTAVLYMTKQAIGMAMVIVALVFLAYAFLGPYLPGILSHNGITLKRMLSTVYLTNEGIFGSSLQVSASEIFPLMMYGGIMVGLGGDSLLMGLAMKALGMFRGGIAKVSVLASALFGMLSGAGPANAATTGAFTIPMMKKYGYEGHFAGAVEATASVGGQIMPPIMGASAFIMAEYLGISYGKLVLCAFPAAILYYFAIFLAVDIEAQKRNLTGLPREEIPELKPVLREHWHLMISVAVLVILLVFFGYGPGAAGFWATVVMAASELINCAVRKKKLDWKELAAYLVDCTRKASSIAISCACAGIILSVVDRSGLAIKMTSMMMLVSGGHLIIMLIMAAFASMIMGMALPTVACYIIVATMVAPSLIAAGVNMYAAHFFSFYFAIVSNITPPVALTAFVAAGIAKSDPIKTAATASRIGIATYILPFLFVWYPGVLLQGSTGDILTACMRSVFTIITIAVAVGGGWFKIRIHAWMRALMIASALCIFAPFTFLNLPSYCVIVGCFVFLYLKSKKELAVNE